MAYEYLYNPRKKVWNRQRGIQSPVRLLLPNAFVKVYFKKERVCQVKPKSAGFATMLLGVGRVCPFGARPVSGSSGSRFPGAGRCMTWSVEGILVKRGWLLGGISWILGGAKHW